MEDSSQPPQNLERISVSVRERAKEIANEVYATCLSEWIIDSDSGYSRSDKVIDLLEELIYNIDHKDTLIHFYSSDRARAVGIECDKVEKRFRAWLYYHTIIAYINVDLRGQSPTVNLDLWRAI
jgi:hypothetical protein